MNVLVLLLLPAAAPPLPTPLPAGAVARLGQARLFLELGTNDRGPLVLSPDGRTLHYGKQRFGLADGFALPDAAEPVELPQGRPILEVREVMGGCDTVSEVWLRAGKVPQLWDKGLLMRGDETDAAVAWYDYRRHKVFVHEIATGKRRTIDVPVEGDEGIQGVALQPTGPLVAVTMRTKTMLFDAKGKAIRSEAFGGSPRFTRDGKRVLVTDHHRTHVVPVSLAEKALNLGEGNGAESVLFPDSRRVAIAPRDARYYGQIRIVDLETGEECAPRPRYAPFAGVHWLDGTRAVAWSRDGRLTYFDALTGRALSEARLPAEGPFAALCFDRDGKKVAAMTWSGSCVLYDAKASKVVARAKGRAAYRPFASFSPDGERLAVVENGDDEAARVVSIDTSSGKRVQSFDAFEGQPVFAPDGRTLLLMGIESAMAYEPSGKARFRLDQWWEWPECPRNRDRDRYWHEPAAAFDRRGRLLTVTHHDRVVRYDAVTGRALRTLGKRCQTLSPSGRWAASFWTNHVLLYDLDARSPERPVVDFATPGGPVRGVAIGPTGDYLLTAHEDGTCHCWDVAKLRAMGTSRPVLTAATWEALADVDAEKANRAIADLVGRPQEAVAFLAVRLRPLPDVPKGKVAEWIEQLGAEDFETRAEASERLDGVLDQAEDELRVALAKSSSLEATLRVRRLLRKLDDPNANGPRLRQVRAVEVLERLGSREAMALLSRLASGAPGARLTREAAASLRRLREG